jgi:hypothetical protein
MQSVPGLKSQLMSGVTGVNDGVEAPVDSYPGECIVMLAATIPGMTFILHGVSIPAPSIALFRLVTVEAITLSTAHLYPDPQ